MKFILVFSLMSLVLLNACDKTPLYKCQRYITRSMNSADTEVMLPGSLWDQLEKAFVAKVGAKGGGHGGGGGGGGEHGGGEHGESKESKPKAEAAAVPLAFAPLRVFMYEKTRGILGGNNYELVFGKGGGLIDLKDFVTNKKGSYNMVIALEGEFDPTTLKVFYLSNSPERNIDDKAVGSGCGKYFDITKYFNTTMTDRGFELNTNKRLDMSVLAGSIFLAATVKDELQVAQLTIKDSRYRVLHCGI